MNLKITCVLLLLLDFNQCSTFVTDVLLNRFSGDHLSLWHLLCRCFLLLRDQLLGDGSLVVFLVVFFFFNGSEAIAIEKKIL